MHLKPVKEDFMKKTKSSMHLNGARLKSTKKNSQKASAHLRIGDLMWNI